MMYRLLDLFSGIGGFSLGLERSGGFKTVAFCEIEDYPRQVLAKHWPGVPIYEDIRDLTADRLRADGIAVDAICGGFPCQDISFAGQGAGLAGERSGLWREYARLIGELRPRFVIVENVAALLGRGLGDVLGDLAALRYDAEWHCIPASAVGAPHRRDRVWIIAYTDCAGDGEQHRDASSRGDGARSVSALANPSGERCGEAGRYRCDEPAQRIAGGCIASGDTDRNGLAVGQSIRCHDVAEFASSIGTNWWVTEPDVGRVAHGVSARVDRLRCLGNAVVPQIPEMIGRAILASEISEAAE